MALIIAGERSGVGKTTVTLALLAFLCQKSRLVQSFKVGPDYIDPMFHQAITSRPCRNLDPILTSEAYVRDCFSRHSQGVDSVLVEGVMGLFDGVPKAKESQQFASTAHIARLLDLPVLLVIDCSRLSGSVAAIAHGYCSLDPGLKFAGVVLNRVGSDRHQELLQTALAPFPLPILGILRRQDAIAIPDRHLGLVPTGELEGLPDLLARLAHLGETCFDWDKLLPLTHPSQYCSVKESSGWDEPGRQREQGKQGGRESCLSEQYCHPPHPPIKLAIARDRAFNFYYQDNLDLLQQLGAELVPWSPLTAETLPKKVQGLYFGGGFPEVFAEELAVNVSAQRAVRAAIESGMPTYAECGGLMYLCDQLIDFAEKTHSMVGILPTTAIMAKNLTLGYRQGTALQDSLLLAAGDMVVGHEFHRSQLVGAPPSPLFALRNYALPGAATPEGWQVLQLHASYLHLHFGGFPRIAVKFLQNCLAFSLGDQLG
jgi:cobyrinic acid a,c-diamide synthase